MTNSPETEVHETMAAINRAWRQNRPSDMKPFLHPEVTMLLPGFGGRITGANSLIASFMEFCTNARVLEFQETDERIQVVGNVALLTFVSTYSMNALRTVRDQSGEISGFSSI